MFKTPWQICAHYRARAVPNAKRTLSQYLSKRACPGFGNSRHVREPTVGNLHLVLQVRYCSATLIFDERMQILYGARRWERAKGAGSGNMMRIMMKSKIHRATVTQADLDYVG